MQRWERDWLQIVKAKFEAAGLPHEPSVMRIQRPVAMARNGAWEDMLVSGQILRLGPPARRGAPYKAFGKNSYGAWQHIGNIPSNMLEEIYESALVGPLLQKEISAGTCLEYDQPVFLFSGTLPDTFKEGATKVKEAAAKPETSPATIAVGCLIMSFLLLILAKSC